MANSRALSDFGSATAQLRIMASIATVIMTCTAGKFGHAQIYYSLSFDRWL
jgi:hypothetical protein